MDESSDRDGPAVLRRRRRIARHQREKTPDPVAKSNGIKRMYSDEESSSTNEFHSSLMSDESGNSRTRTNQSNVAYRNKILSYRDRGCGTSSMVRSKSTPRSQTKKPTDEIVTPIQRNSSSNQVIAFFQQAKRSLSIPR